MVYAVSLSDWRVAKISFHEMKSGGMKKIVLVSIVLSLLLMLWIPFAVGRVLIGAAPWGPKVGGKLANGTAVYFQARPGGFETDDRLTVIDPNGTPAHYWVDTEHAGFAHVTLKHDASGTKVWVESDGAVGASIDLSNNDFRSEHDDQHQWAVYGTGVILDSGYTVSLLSILRPW